MSMRSSPGTPPNSPHFETVSTIFARVRTHVAQRTSRPEFGFGLASLDDATCGIRRGKVTIVAARTSEGKTSLAIQTAAHLAIEGKTVAYISLEDDRETLVEKLYCQQAGVAGWRLQQGDVSALAHAPTLALFERLHLLVLDNFGYTLEELRYVLQTLDPSPEILVLDYVQMIQQAQHESEYDALSRFVRAAKVFAEQSKIGLVLLCQINRTGARDGRPELHHLAGCGRLEQVADLVLLLFWPYGYHASSHDYREMRDQTGSVTSTVGFKDCPPEYFELSVAKNKTGPRNLVVPLRFDGPTYRFLEWAPTLEESLYGAPSL